MSAYEADSRELLGWVHVYLMASFPLASPPWSKRQQCARDAAESGGLAVIDLSWRDINVPLSDLGVAQSIAAGDWFAQLPEAERPEVVLCSPYLRAEETARLIVEGGGFDLPNMKLRLDERLREKEFGIFDRLTKFWIQQKHPELNEQRLHVGRFYFRPPGGESWSDVILRLRSLLEMVTRKYAY